MRHMNYAILVPVGNTLRLTVTNHQLIRSVGMPSMAVKITHMDIQNVDLLVVNAARVSMAKEHRDLKLPEDEKLLNYLAREKHWTPFAHPQFYRMVRMPASSMVHYLLETENYQFRRVFKEEHNDLFVLFEGGSLYAYIKNGLIPKSIQESLAVKSLIRYSGLPKEDFKTFKNILDWEVPSPIRHRTFRLEMPIFVARQWFKHQIGFVRNERSRRYVSGGIEYFVPKTWRKAPESSIKQGSGEDFDQSKSNVLSMHLQDMQVLCEQQYEAFIQYGVSAEMSRMVLPQNMMIEFVETGSLAAYNRLLDQRLDSHAQKEIREGAKKLKELLYGRTNSYS